MSDREPTELILKKLSSLLLKAWGSSAETLFVLGAVMVYEENKVEIEWLREELKGK